MKTTMKAAILLLGGTLFFSQAGLAGKPDNKPPPKEECSFFAAATACTVELAHAYEMLVVNQSEFNKSRDYGALTCKVSASDIKISQDKPADAELKLSDSVVKINTLFTQGKISSYEAAMDMADAMEDARACAEAEANK
jgi:N-acetylmuramic acid 6-phosphate (MurNAc-6-P) etherase